MPEGGDWKELYDAACEGRLNTISNALRMGVDPNYQHPEYGTTPLIAAVEKGQIEAARLLIQGGADPDIKSQWDLYSARELAAEKGDPAMLNAIAGN